MILSRVKFYPQERVDLEDILTLLSAARTDSKLWTKEFLSASNYILKGFAVSGLGVNHATVAMTDATFIIGGGTSDFSYFIAEPGASDLNIPPSSIVAGVRNYIELSLGTQDGTPITKAFWDSSANGGLGAEFNQTINTVTDLLATPIVVQGGFTGLPDRLPVAIMDVDGFGTIKLIFDRRNLFWRQGTPTNPENTFTWASQQEPTYAVNITSPVGTFVTGETVTFTGGVTATVALGGTTDILIRLPSGINFTSGNTITGGTSGATGTVNTVLESFTGADKDIQNSKENDLAIKEEIRQLKNTPFWYSPVTMSSSGLSNFVNSEIVAAPAASTPDFSWDGSNLSITDSNGSPSSSDALANITILGTSETLNLQRADGNAGTSVIPIGSGQVLFIQLPTSGNRNYSGNGSGATNYQVVNQSAFVQSDQNYWIAFRVGNELFIRGQGELSVGQSIPIAQASSGGSITKVTLYDNVFTSLPTGSSYTGDGVAISNGQTVLFTNLSSGNNEVYKVSGVGSSLSWTPQSVFTNGRITPSTGDQVLIVLGNSFALQVGTFNGTTFKFNDVVRYFSGSDYWEQSSLKTTNMADATTGTVFSVTAAGSENMIIDYSILRNGKKETGSLHLTHDGVNVRLNTSVAYTNATAGVDFSAVIVTGTLTLSYITDSQGIGGVLKYSLKRWSDSSGGPGGPPSYSAGGGGGSGITGSGSAGALAIWDSSTDVTSDPNLSYDSVQQALQLGSGANILQETILHSVAIPSGAQSNALMFSYPKTFTFAIVEYSALIGSNYRVGTLMIAQDGVSSIVVTDTFTEIGSTGLSFATPGVSDSIGGSNVNINFNATGVGSGTFKYSMRRWA